MNGTSLENHARETIQILSKLLHVSCQQRGLKRELCVRVMVVVCVCVCGG